MTVGQEAFRYELDDSWPTLPEGWALGSVPDLAIDSSDRVFVFCRHKHPVVVFEAGSGKFVTPGARASSPRPTASSSTATTSSGSRIARNTS